MEPGKRRYASKDEDASDHPILRRCRTSDSVHCQNAVAGSFGDQLPEAEKLIERTGEIGLTEFQRQHLILLREELAQAKKESREMTESLERTNEKLEKTKLEFEIQKLTNENLKLRSWVIQNAKTSGNANVKPTSKSHNQPPNHRQAEMTLENQNQFDEKLELCLKKVNNLLEENLKRDVKMALMSFEIEKLKNESLQIQLWIGKNEGQSENGNSTHAEISLSSNPK